MTVTIRCACVLALLLATPLVAAQVWTVKEGEHVPQGDPSFVEVVPAEDMDPNHPRPANIDWSQSGVRFYPSWSWNNPQPGDYICWLYDWTGGVRWWKCVFNQPSTSLHIQLVGCDGNDGWVDIFLDGSSAPDYSYQTKDKNKVAIQVGGLANIAHTVELRTRPSGHDGAGDVSFDYVAHPAKIFDHKMHFPQWPDEDGWDVNATAPLWLADDWVCTSSGPVNDIHFWGSWLNDIEGQITAFNVRIYDDVPADPNIPGSHSHPGTLLWEERFESFGVNGIDPPTSEGWYDPSNGEILPDNHVHYFQYDLYPFNAFVQTEGEIYWLAISAEVTGGVWGWKSTEDHWNDDAVWSLTPDDELSWVEMYEPLVPDIVEDDFFIEINELGDFVNGGGSGYNFGEWYYYPDTDWYNIWFWDHPYNPDRIKVVHIYLNLLPMNLSQPSEIYLAVNWSTPDWWLLDYGPDSPPLPDNPDFDEAAHLGREVLLHRADPPICRGDLNCDGLVNFGDINPFVTLLVDGYFAWQAIYPGCPGENGDINENGDYGQDGSADFGDINPFVALLTGFPSPVCPPPEFGGIYELDWTLWDYNPEWISIDVRGYNFIISEGQIWHSCEQEFAESLDLSFVITE